MRANRALILDRDGVINVDKSYVYKKEQIQFIQDIFHFCRTAKKHGYLLIVTTNQSGIGRGYFNEDEFKSLTKWMCGIFEKEQCSLDKVYYCPFHPVHGIGKYCKSSVLRKPSPGMILQAAAEFDLDLENCICVGDKVTDMQAGIAAGITKNLLFQPPPNNNVPADYFKTISKLSEAEAYL